MIRNFGVVAYVNRMRKSPIEPCIPTRGTKVPDRPEWIHEIKHDGYRLIIQRDGKRVRLFTRNGHDWSNRFPLITEAALRNRNSSFVIDGEAVLLGVDGISDFDGLHSRKHDDEAQFHAFDWLVSDGDDVVDQHQRGAGLLLGAEHHRDLRTSLTSATTASTTKKMATPFSQPSSGVAASGPPSARDRFSAKF
jgi:ATP-dependent DNA ligase